MTLVYGFLNVRNDGAESGDDEAWRELNLQKGAEHNMVVTICKMDDR